MDTNLTLLKHLKLAVTAARNFTNNLVGQVATAASEAVEELENTKADKVAVLTKTNTEEFAPTSSYHPATKKYVDDGLNAALSEITEKTTVIFAESMPESAEIGTVCFLTKQT